MGLQFVTLNFLIRFLVNTPVYTKKTKFLIDLRLMDLL